MEKPPDLRENFDPPPEIIDAGLDGDLIFFVGAGVSMLLGLPSWSELANKILGDLQEKGYLNYSEIEQLKDLDPKIKLSIAYSIIEEKEYELDFKKHLCPKNNVDSNIYRTINDIGCTCVTTNYDELLDPRFINTEDGSKTSEKSIRICEREKFLPKWLDKPGIVIHLHGAITKRKTMIVTTKDYFEHYRSENVRTILQELFKRKTILFIGYSLEEIEILEHIFRSGSIEPTTDIRRFILQGFYLSQRPLYENLYHYYLDSFGVHLLGFIRDYDDYKCLEKIIKDWANKIEIKKPKLTTDINFMDEVLDHD